MKISNPYNDYGDKRLTEVIDTIIRTLNNIDSVNITSLKDKSVTNATIEDKFFAYGQAYRTADYSFAGADTWYDLGLTGGNKNLKNIVHSTSVNPASVYVTYSGIYRIKYSVAFKGAAAPDIRVVHSRLFVTNTTEIVGSGVTRGVSATAYNPTINDREVIVSLTAGQYITIQVGVNATEPIVGVYVAVLNPATQISAILTIQKIGEA